MKLVFTDLDGTLLDHDTYSFEPARAALEALRQAGVPVIFVTSKTRAETEFWRARTGNRDPFVTENGGAAVIPAGTFPFEAPEEIVLGTRYPVLVAALERAARAAGVRVRGFHSLSVREVAEAASLPLEQAELAKRREFDEPFEILDEAGAAALLAAIEAEGMRWTRGGRFYHITGNNDKAAAARGLIELYRRVEPEVATFGFGDGWNDAPLLDAVDVPVAVLSPATQRLRELVPRAAVTRLPGPAGWSAAVFELVLGRPAG